MIDINNLTKSFREKKAIDDVSLQINNGDIIGIVGPDGAGKTTLIRLMLGLLRPTSGTIKIFGTPDIESCKARFGYVAQKFSLYRDLTVLENLKLIGALYGAKNQAVMEKAQEILTFTGLWPFRDRLSEHLSGGMKQKLALAAGLLHKPEILFLDEPTTGVDPVSRREFWHLLYQLNQQGLSIIIATPYMEEAELCHKIAFMEQGKVIDFQSPADLVSRYPFEILELNTQDRRILADLAAASILDINPFGSRYHIVTNDTASASACISQSLRNHNQPSSLLRVIKPSLEDVFVHLADKAGGNQ